MINIKNLSIAYSGKPIFEEANFIINAGEKIGLIGKNGSGKSTFFKLMLKKINPSEGSIDIPQGYRMGHLEQHIHFTYSTAIEEVCSVLPEEREHEGWKGEKIMLGLGFTEEQINEDPMKFSGGYQIKVNLAKILLMEPDMLLLDEPTNYLDIYSIRWLGSFLRKWKNELILITHDRSFMDSIISHTLVIHRNGFKKIAGKTDKILEQIEKEETIYEDQRIREDKERQKTAEWIKKFGSKASLASRAQSMQKSLDKKEVKIKLSDIQGLSFKFNYLPYISKDKMMSIQNISFGYEPEKLLIKNLSFDVIHGDKICIIGKNGNGKSTLLQVLAGNEKPYEGGSVYINEKVNYGYFGQMNVERLNPEKTICQELEEVDSKLDITSVRRVCGNMMFQGDLAFKKIGVLSGGEKSRVMLGKIVLTPVNILLLDEPTNHFDMESSEALMEAIKNFPGSVIMVTHNEYFLRQIATKLIIFDGGKTFAFEGTYDEFLKKVGWAE